MQNYLDDIFFFIGAAFISIGAAMIYIPAGIISVGVFCLLASLIYGRYLANSQPRTLVEELEEKPKG